LAALAEDKAVWTPKRVLLLVAGIAVFLAGYAVYAFFLGGIDGMPPLPEQFLRADSPILIGTFDPSETEIDRKLRMAFGKDCAQIKKKFKFEIRKKGMVVAASDFSFKERDGRVKLEDFSIAIFRDDITGHGEGNWPEINTVISDHGFLSFADDKGEPVKIESPNDMSKPGVKICGAELRGHILIINNRHSEEKSDDLDIIVDNEPLFYEESTAKIWTNGFVKLLDKQTHPHPTSISGHGMEMLLTKEQPANNKQQAAKAPKAKNDMSGVERIELKKTVEMHLYTDANSGFLSGPGKSNGKSNGNDSARQAPTGERQADQETSHIMITTEGPFVYEKSKELARFESPPGKQNAHFPDRVLVRREPLRGDMSDQWDKKYDQIVCDYLTLKFARESPPATAKNSKSNAGPKIESAQATARQGAEVVVLSDSENLECHCQQLDYFAPVEAEDRGARTLLRGDPLRAAKDGHKITSATLELISANQKGFGQQMLADGPGQVDLFDPSPDPASGDGSPKGYVTHARWKSRLTQTKTKEGSRDLDLLTLDEDAVFIDDEHQQQMFGQRLQVWLESSDSAAKMTPSEAGRESTPGGPRQKPVKVEAFNRVKAISPDFRIDARDHLIIRFEDTAYNRSTAAREDFTTIPSQPAPPAQRLPSVANGGNPASASTPQAAIQNTPSVPSPPNASAGSPLSLGITFPARQGQETAKEKEKPKRPINLSANDVAVDVLRGADKNDLKELLAVGNVYVHQDGENPTDKGVNIEGDTLSLAHFAEGDIIKVFGEYKEGESKKGAALQLDETYLSGPKVTIDQKTNRAVVEGAGVMSMPSNTTFSGDKPLRPGARLTVHWSRDMLFDGQEAEFRGEDYGVVAYQDDSTLQCHFLQVTLDRRVSLKEGQKGEQKAKVDKVLANASNAVVCVLEKTKDSKGWPQVQRLLCTTLAVDNTENQLNASGPGSAAALQYETGGDLDSGKTTKQAKDSAKSPQQMLTQVNYQGQMFSKQQTESSRWTRFLNRVTVLHVPANTLEPKLDKLPKDGLMLTCDKLTVVEQKRRDGSKSQVMEADMNVSCQANDLFFRAEKAIFDKSEDTITLRGSPGNPATVSRQAGGPGSAYKTNQGQTIRYNRKTNELNIDGANVLSGKLEPLEWSWPVDALMVAIR
jgi:hypothetical protein